MSYNGWTNYQTWLVKLWFDNDASMEDFVRELIAVGNDTYDLSISLKNYVEENKPEHVGLYADLLNAALAEVNWYEIAEAYMEELKDDVNTEGEE
jgi:hypothetical protein